MEMIDSTIREIITKQLGKQEAKVVLDSIESYMLENNVITAPPLVGDGQTKGDWRISLSIPNGQKQDIRPGDALSYVIIKEMLKSGPIRFALEMKRSQMVSVFRNRRSVSVYSQDQELARVGEFVVEHVLPFAAFEFTWSALVYGAAFMEGVWETKTLSQLGLQGDKLYTVPKQLNLVPHDTVRHIIRTNGGDFDGFVQMADYKLGTYYIVSTPNVQTSLPGDITVEAESALVIPYNGFSRNLWGESFLYPLYPLWFWYEITIRSLVRYTELMGDPPRLGKAPSKKKIRLSANSNELVDAIDYLLAIAVNLSKSNAVVIPSDKDEQGRDEWDLGYMIAPDRSQPFVQILELFNSMILRAGLTGDKTYSTVQGPGVPSAIGQIGAEATALHNEMVVSSWLHYLNTYWFSKISKYNLGENGVPAWLEIQGLDPKEREFLIQIANIAGNSSTFQEFFYKVDWESLGKMSGLPMFTEDQAAELKQKLQEQDLQNQVEQTRAQNELGIENQIENAKVQQKIAKEIAPQEQTSPEEPSNLEVQMKLEELTRGKVPIFFTQEEIKKFAVEKETATQRNFFIPSKPYNRDLALALALAYKYKTIQLIGNPFHDKLGRFASKTGGRVEQAKEFISEHKKEIVIAGAVGVALAAVGGAIYLKRNQPDSRLFAAVSNKWSGQIEFKSNQGLQRDSIRQQVIRESNVAAQATIAMNELNAMGIQSFNHKKIIFDNETGMRQDFNELANVKTASYNPKTKEINVSGFVIEDLLSENKSDQILATETLAHEFYHARIAAKGEYPNVGIEEGLATIAGSVVGKRIAENRFGEKLSSKDLNEDLLTHIDKTYHSIYAERARKLFHLSRIGRYGGGGRDDLDYLIRWISSTPKDYAQNIKDILGLANFERIDLETIQLFNPLHDELGKFASKAGSAVVQTIGAKFRKSHETLAEPANGFMNDKKFMEAYQSVPTQLRPAVVTPVEYLSRKEGLGPRAARIALDAGTDVAFSWTVGSACFTNGAMLGGLATAAVATALFGAVPTAAVVIGGLVIGAGASAIATQIFRHAKTEYMYSFLDRYAPKDDAHVGFVHNGRDWKTHRTEMYKTAGSEIAFDVAMKAFGPYAGIPGSWSVINNLKELEVERDDESFAVVLLPYVSAMLMGRVNSISVPYDLEGYPGFRHDGENWVITKDTVEEFTEAWLAGTLPYKECEFGDTSVTLDETLLEGEESIQLGNPNHDKLGRFASKQGQAARFFGGLDSKRQVDLKQAQRLTNKRVKEVSKRFDSGLVDGLETKLCNDWTCVKKETGISGNALGVYYHKKLVMTPHGLTYSSYDDKKFFNRVVDHETVHARKRSQGGSIIVRTKGQMDLEEGCTEILSMGMNGYPYHKSPYLNQMRAVAKAARNGAGNDKDKAWKIVSQMHYHNDTDRGLSAFQAYTAGKGSNTDIEWLMGTMPRKLELDEDEKEFEKSEKEIYKTLRKVQDRTFNGEPKPFSEEELR